MSLNLIEMRGQSGQR